jgi:predicted Rossmann fold nucleotide-binding protein DprA/Smf involved in DNA uptake
VDIEKLAFEVNMPVRQLSERLLRLEMAGLIEWDGAGYATVGA